MKPINDSTQRQRNSGEEHGTQNEDGIRERCQGTALIGWELLWAGPFLRCRIQREMSLTPTQPTLTFPELHPIGNTPAHEVVFTFHGHLGWDHLLVFPSCATVVPQELKGTWEPLEHFGVHLPVAKPQILLDPQFHLIHDLLRGDIKPWGHPDQHQW